MSPRDSIVWPEGDGATTHRGLTCPIRMSQTLPDRRWRSAAPGCGGWARGRLGHPMAIGRMAIRWRLGEQDWASLIAHLARQEVNLARQGEGTVRRGHFDLSVGEAWRALEAGFPQVLISRRIEPRSGGPDAVIYAATRKGSCGSPRRGRRGTEAALDGGRQHRPLSREATVESLSTVRHVLSVIPVKEPAQVPGSGSGVVLEKAPVHA